MSAFSQVSDRPLEHRSRVTRMALLYTPISIVSLLLVFVAIYKISTGNSGFIFMLVLFGLILLLTGFQAVQYIKDLSAEPIALQGELVRKWHKGNLFIFFLPSFYIAIDSGVLKGRISRIEDGGAYVTMETGHEGFIPRKEMVNGAGDPDFDEPRPGSEVKFKALGVHKDGLYKLSSRKAEGPDIVTRLFSITRTEYGMLLEQDLIRVTSYPHSLTVERIERYDDHEKKFVPATDGATV